MTPVTSYKFEVGSLVRLTTPIARAADGQYQVVGRLPDEGDALRYRIKSADEPYERVVKEYQLRALKLSS